MLLVDFIAATIEESSNVWNYNFSEEFQFMGKKKDAFFLFLIKMFFFCAF